MAAFDLDSISLGALRRRRSAKWRYHPADVIPAWVAEMDFPLAEPVADALRRAIDDSDTGYQWPAEAAEACAEYAGTAWGWQFAPSRVTVLPDVITGLTQAILHLTSPGEGVVITPPVYHPFFTVIGEITGRVVVEAPLQRAVDGTVSLDLDLLEAAFARPDVTAFVMSHPHNPTGTVWTLDDLRAIAELAAEHDVSVISDEIHAPLVLPGSRHVPYLTVAGDDADAVALMSASKAWNLAGLKCSQLVCSARTVATVGERIPMEVGFASGHLGGIATVAAYREGGPWLEQVIGILDGNRTLLADLLASRVPAARYAPPHASYLAWLDLLACGLGDDPAEVLLERARVGLSAGTAFGREGSGFARLNFATTPAILREIVDRIGAVVQ